MYYIQYAHARIASILRKLPDARVAEAVGSIGSWGDASLDVRERSLIKRIAAFPEEVAEAAARRGPHRISGYASSWRVTSRSSTSTARSWV